MNENGQVRNQCKLCQGVGLVKAKRGTYGCPKCEGTGWVWVIPIYKKK